MGLVKYNNQSISSISDVSGSDASMVLIKTVTASSDSTISFVDGTDDVVLDNTYPIYKFIWINIHPATDAAKFTFQGNAAGGSGYNETITSSFFYAYHDEADSETGVSYYSGGDQAQGTSFQRFSSGGVGNGNDEGTSGEMWLFNPSSTTYVKNFISRNSTYQDNNSINDNYVSGYFNTTSAIDEIQFKFDSGNIDAGTIKLYGIKDS